MNAYTQYIEREHAICKRSWRLTQAEVDDDIRVLPRNLRRRLARKFGFVRVPVAITLDDVASICADLSAELDRRAIARLAT